MFKRFQKKKRGTVKCMYLFTLGTKDTASDSGPAIKDLKEGKDG